MQKIMFNDAYGLTQATIESRKTMTRRIIPHEFFTLTWDVRDDTLVYENDFGDFIDIRRSIYAHYHVGEVVAVAQSYETIAPQHQDVDYFFDEIAKAHHIDVSNVSKLVGYRNKMFVKAELMPYRIRITGIRIEHLQDISDEECINEGVMEHPYQGYMVDGIVYKNCRYKAYNGSLRIFGTPREAFAALIDKVSRRGTWARNPWVVAYEYELVK